VKGDQEHPDQVVDQRAVEGDQGRLFRVLDGGFAGGDPFSDGDHDRGHQHIMTDEGGVHPRSGEREHCRG